MRVQAITIADDRPLTAAEHRLLDSEIERHDVADDCARARCDLTAADIGWDLAPAPWDTPQIALTSVIEAIELTDHPTILAALEQLACALVARDEQLRATRLLLSATGTALHESDRRRQQLAYQLAECRAARRGQVTRQPAAAGSDI